MRNSLLLECYKYGLHLGSNLRFNTNLNNFVVGIRFDYAIINVVSSLTLLKKAMYFLKVLSSNSGNICFFYSLFNKLNIIYKASLLNIVSRSFQSIICHPWIYGSLTNYYFSYLSFIKDIVDIIESDDYFNNFRTRKDLITRTMNSNKSNTLLFLRRACNSSLYTFLKKKKIFNFRYFFLRFFFFLSEKSRDYLFLNKQLEMKSYYSKLSKRVLFYWRVLLYYRYFQNFLELPDCFFSISPDRNDVPLREICFTGEVISIGLVDTDCSIENLHYPIVSNDDSLVIIFFFFTLFSNIFLENKINIYNLFSHK